MSILAFQKLSGELSTDGKILLELEKLNSKNQDTEILAYAKELYPNKLLKLIQRAFNTTDNEAIGPGSLWDTDPLYLFGGRFFGKWTISVFTGDQNTTDTALKAFLFNIQNQKLALINENTSGFTLIGEASGLKRYWGRLNVAAQFIGYEILENWSYSTVNVSDTFQIIYDSAYYLQSPNNIKTFVQERSGFMCNVTDSKPFKVQIGNELYNSSFNGNHYIEFFPVPNGGYIFESIEEPVNTYFEIRTQNVNGIQFSINSGNPFGILNNSSAPVEVIDTIEVTAFASFPFIVDNDQGITQFLELKADGNYYYTESVSLPLQNTFINVWISQPIVTR